MGKPVQIISVDQDGIIQLHKENLQNILLASNVKDKAVAVVSINGAARKGKSFLMNFLLRYLYHDGKSNWMGDDKTPLKGFDWTTSMDPNTKGIYLWDEAFMVPTTSGGEEMAVLLMDTQGAFDSESTNDLTANIFALSILTCSVQIYNVSENLQENDLQHLQFVAEYGKTIQKGTNAKPFQKLVFLVRGWRFPCDEPYGVEGGSRVLSKVMATTPKQDPELQNLRKGIKSSFSNIDCFLMPDPGKKSLWNSFQGSLQELDEDFKQTLKEFVPWLLAPTKLSAKDIAGKEITCQELMTYFERYTDAFKSPDRHLLKTLLKVTTDESNRQAKEEAKKFYIKEMLKRRYENLEELVKNHRRLLHAAKAHFQRTSKFGDDDISNLYLNMLEKDIMRTFDPVLTELKQAVAYSQKLASLHQQLQEDCKTCIQKTVVNSIGLILGAANLPMAPGAAVPLIMDRANALIENIAELQKMSGNTAAIVTQKQEIRSLPEFISSVLAKMDPSSAAIAAENQEIRSLSGSTSTAFTIMDSVFAGNAAGYEAGHAARVLLESALSNLTTSLSKIDLSSGNAAGDAARNQLATSLTEFKEEISKMDLSSGSSNNEKPKTPEGE